MNTPNPLHPQGAFPDGRGRSHVRIAVFTILAVHVVLLGALLLQGCKRTSTEADAGKAAAPLASFAPTTNVVSPPPEIATFTPPPEPVKVEPPPPAPAPAPAVVTPPPPEPITPPPPTPAVVPPPPSAPSAPDREHTVAKGESFFTIAKKYGVTSKAIADANPGVDSRRLKLNQKLKIPAAVEAAPTAPEAAPAPEGKMHTVASGQNLFQIAKSYGTSVKAVRSANNLKTDRLVVGQKLKIPEPTPKATGSAPVTLTPPPAIPGAK